MAAFISNRTITILDLSQNKIGDKFGGTLSTALKVIENMRKFSEFSEE
jgi:hypothetical protein